MQLSTARTGFFTLDIVPGRVGVFQDRLSGFHGLSSRVCQAISLGNDGDDHVANPTRLAGRFDFPGTSLPVNRMGYGALLRSEALLSPDMTAGRGS